MAIQSLSPGIWTVPHPFLQHHSIKLWEVKLCFFCFIFLFLWEVKLLVNINHIFYFYRLQLVTWTNYVKVIKLVVKNYCITFTTRKCFKNLMMISIRKMFVSLFSFFNKVCFIVKTCDFGRSDSYWLYWIKWDQGRPHLIARWL